MTVPLTSNKALEVNLKNETTQGINNISHINTHWKFEMALVLLYFAL